MTVVCNTSPLLLLARIGQLDLLLQLYDTIIIPGAVLDEINAVPDEAAERIHVLVQGQHVRPQQTSKQMLDRISEDLGAGERAALALALEIDADLVILDDQQGRDAARESGQSVTGTIGLFIEAQERGLVESLRPILDRLVEAGLWISEAFYHQILQQVNE